MSHIASLKTLLTTLLVGSLTWAAQAQFTNFTHIGGGATGSIVTNAGTGSYTFEGGGNDIWSATDEFDYAHFEATGDFDLRARVESLEPTARWAKAGLMVRENLNGNSRMGFTRVTPGDVPTGNGGNGANDTRFGFRIGTTSGVQGENEAGSGGPEYPNGWVRLQRVGNSISSYRSSDGASWSLLGTQDTTTWEGGALPASVQLGFAVARHSGAEPLATAQFRDYGSPSNAIAIGTHPASITRVVGQTATFRSSPAGGSDFAVVQWFTNGVPIPGANSVAYTTPALTLADSGVVYALGVSNIYDASVALSSGATLTVVDAPELVSGTTLNNPAAVYLTFTRAMNSTALNPANYSVNNGVTVSAAEFTTPASNVVKITTTALAVNTTYQVSVSGVQDLAGTTLNPDPSSVNVAHDPGLTYGAITMRRFDGSGDFNIVKDKINNCVPPNRVNPNLATFAYGTNPSINNSDGDTDNYGTWIYGYFVPATTGNYRFAIKSDDSSELYLSTDASPANKVLLTAELGCCTPYTSHVSALIPLVAGQRYFLEARHQEGGGGDHVQVTFQAPGGPDITDADPAIPNSQFASVYTLGCPPVAVNALGPVAFSTGLTNVSVVENSVATFVTVPDGSPPFTAQWYSNGVPIAGATGMSYSLNAQIPANGKVFTVVVNNLFSSATNSSTLTVIPAPQILNAGSRLDPSGASIYVEFSKDMGAAALVPGSYAVNNGITVSGADFHNGNPRLVRLTVSALTAGVAYDVTGTGITDPDGNVLNPNPTTRSFTHLAGVNPPTGLTLSRFDGANSLALVRNAINNCTVPSFTDTNVANVSYFPNLDNYGTWFRGQFAPPTTGNYQFAVAGDDNVQLFLSTDEFPANRVMIAQQPSWGRERDYVLPPKQVDATVATASGLIPLVAGRTYYFELLHQEGGGGDNVQATVRLPGGPPIVDDAPDIPRSLFATKASVGCPPTAYFDNLGPLSIVSQPGNTTVTELFPASFRVQLDGSPNYSFQWYSNNVPVPGATSASYTFSPLRYANGAQYLVVAANGFSSVTSAPATLTVISDETPPGFVRAFGSGVFTNVTVVFNEPVELVSAATAGNYTITNSAGVPLTVYSAFVRDNTNVVLRTDAQTTGERYTVIVNNVLDRAGVPNPVTPNSLVSFTAWVFTPGYALMEVYAPIGLTTILSLTNHPTYPNYPRERYYITTTSSRAVYADDSKSDYGGRISGLFVPTSTANYTFRISRDDDARLNGSLTENPENAQTIINVACCDDTFAAASPPLPLTAGNRYYYELLWKEAGGGDYGKLSIDGVNSIPASFLGVYANPDDANLQIIQGPTNITRLEGQTATFSIAATASPGYTITYQWYSNSVAIAGAIGASHTTPVCNILNNGDTYTVVTIVPGALATNSAVLTVEPDVTPPTLLSARVSEDRTQVILTYSEAISPLGDASNFYLDAGTPGVTVRTVVGNVITLTFEAALSLHTPYILYGEFQQDLYGNLTDPNVTETPLFLFQPYGLRHRYSFLNNPGAAGGANVLDSVGGAHGVVLGANGTFNGQVLQLPGGSSATEAYVDLPNGLLSTNAVINGGSGQVTLEGWTRVTGSRGWSRIFDFGSTSGTEITGPGGSGNGRRYLMLAAQVDQDVNTHRLEATADDGSYPNAFTQDFPALFNQVEHWVVMWDDVNNRIRTYVNGILRQDFATAASIGDVNDVNVWLGRSTWTGDQNMQGDFDEFRMYDRLLTPEEIAFNDAVGPNYNFGATAAVRVEVPSTNMVENSSQQAQVFVDFVGGPSNVNLTLSRSFTLISDNPAILGVSPSSLLTTPPAAGGVANLVATFNGVSSAPLAINVIQDVIKPTVLSVNGVRTLDGVKIVFSEPVNLGQATEPSNYTLTDTNSNPVNFGPPVLAGDQRTVTLPIIGGHAPGQVYVLDISGIEDLAGVPNLMEATNFTFQTWIWSRGFAIADYYTDIGGVLVSDLTNNPAYPNSPNISEYVSLFEARADWADNYGGRLTAVVRPPRSGTYELYLSADDQAALFLSTDANPANLLQIATEPVWNGGREYITGSNAGSRGDPAANIASNIVLSSSSSNYIQALNKEGGGGDNLSATWHIPGTLPVVNGSLPIHGTHLSSLADPVGASVTITQQPLSTNIWIGQPLTLTVAAVGTNVNGVAPITYQWQRLVSGNWVDILGANSASYVIASAPPGLNAQYRALIFIPGAEATSSAATVMSMLAIQWPGPPDILQEADEVTGPWTDIPGATNPFIVNPGDAPKKFYKLKPLP